MTLKEFALKLRVELLNGEMPEHIATKILAKNLTTDENDIIINYLIDSNYDPKIGTVESNESDNSSLLSAISTIRNMIKGGK